MHLEILESTQEPRVALSFALSNLYTSLMLSKLPACICIPHSRHEPIVSYKLKQFQESMENGRDIR